MAGKNVNYRCNECETKYSKWAGRCEVCGQWNTIEQTTTQRGYGSIGLALGTSSTVVISDLATESDVVNPTNSGLNELDRVLGGGFVPSSAVLVGGSPGIGKSTLLLQAAAAYSARGSAYYFTGEEALSQIQMRAIRLGITQAKVGVAAATNLREILATLEQKKPRLVVLDSIQTMWSDSVDGAPGSITQVRSVGYEIVQFAKRSGAATVLVGHVTKEGHLAGPRVIEHMVDTVLYFEGDRSHQFRILRSVKNRYGPADEIGVFEMTSTGLNSVENPSLLFLSNQSESSPGSVVFAGIEGTRPLLVEIQALVAPSAFSSARRAVVGWDSGRMSMILAVLETRCGIGFASQDVYLNVAGGLRLTEPAADLAVAAAILSAQSGRPLPAQSAIFGEISLSGSIRAVSQPEARLKECVKLGFNKVYMPASGRRLYTSGINVKRQHHLKNTVAQFFSETEK